MASSSIIWAINAAFISSSFDIGLLLGGLAIAGFGYVLGGLDGSREEAAGLVTGFYYGTFLTYLATLVVGLPIFVFFTTEGLAGFVGPFASSLG